MVDVGSLLPTTETAALVVLAFFAGAACPVYYAEERMRGFGRALMNRLPYVPPPGLQEEEAMVAAAQAEADQEAAASSSSGAADQQTTEDT